MEAEEDARRLMRSTGGHLQVAPSHRLEFFQKKGSQDMPNEFQDKRRGNHTRSVQMTVKAEKPSQSGECEDDE